MNMIMITMTNQKHSGYYMNRILKLLPENTKMQSKDLLIEAQKPIKEIGKNGRVIMRKGMSPNTVYRYLDMLVDEKKLVNRFKEKGSKQVYFLKSKNVHMVEVSSELIQEKVSELISDIPKEIERTVKAEFDYIKQFEETTERDEQALFRQLSESDFEIERAFGFALLKHAFKIIETHASSGMKASDFYIDFTGDILPKALVDSKISEDDRKTWELGSNWRAIEQAEKDELDQLKRENEKERQKGTNKDSSNEG
jgi:Fe2+ or Zn2+ uptake regulation protein